MNDHNIWRDMFVLGLPLLEKIIRPVLVYAFLVISLRLSGKRELVQLNPFDLVVLLTLSNTVQNAIIDAVAHLGVRHIDMPATSRRVWQAIREARARTENA